MEYCKEGAPGAASDGVLGWPRIWGEYKEPNRKEKLAMTRTSVNHVDSLWEIQNLSSFHVLDKINPSSGAQRPTPRSTLPLILVTHMMLLKFLILELCRKRTCRL